MAQAGRGPSRGVGRLRRSRLGPAGMARGGEPEVFGRRRGSRRQGANGHHPAFNLPEKCSETSLGPVPDPPPGRSRLGLPARAHHARWTRSGLAGRTAGPRERLFPSGPEALGLPMLEAMLHDCPVISSPCSCLPEIAGDAALYCDPDRPDAWAAAMETIAFSDDEAAALRRRGHARVAAFTWEENARRHMDVYRQL